MENFIYTLIIIIILIVIVYLLNNNIHYENFFNYVDENKSCIKSEHKYDPDLNDNLNACENPYAMPTGMPCQYKPKYNGFPVESNEMENKIKEKPGYASNLNNLTNDCSFTIEGDISCNKSNNNVTTWEKLGKENGWANQWENKIMFQDTYAYKNNAYPINSFDLKNKTKYEHGWEDNQTNKNPKPSIIGVDGVKFTYN